MHSNSRPNSNSRPLDRVDTVMEVPKPEQLTTDNQNGRVSAIARRIHGWSWQAFPIGMGTGAVYVTLSGVYNHSHGILIIEEIFYFLNIALFLINCSTLFLQFCLYPRQSLRLIKDPVKGIFVPLIVLSFATIIIGTINYLVPIGDLQTSILIPVLFYIYVAASVLVCFPMLMIWYNKPHDINTFTPGWAFLVFPMMLVGVVAFNVLRVIPSNQPRAVAILLVGYTFQGLGSCMTFFYICIYILRIMTTGFMDGHQANGAFVACGPPGFTALALIRLAEQAKKILPAHNLVSPMAGEIWYAASILIALMLFGLSVFLFLFGLFPYWFKVHKNLRDILGCWALTFPNVGWISTIRALADIFKLEAFYIWHYVMAAAMALTWLILAYLTATAFWKGKIFMAKPEEVLQDIQYTKINSASSDTLV